MQAPEVLGGRYELRHVLGRGGMAEVRDGWDRRLNRPVAVKLLHPVYGADPQNRRRFDLEARAAARLNHPNVVAVHDSGDDDGTPYIVMERLPGHTLADAVAAGPLPPERVRMVLDRVLSALAAAHAAGILHRDIKPGNILFTDSGDIRVVDFGIAKSPGGALTEAGQVFGTMAYLSAERMAGRPATVADDLYAVGVVGYEAVSGRRPFPQDNVTELVNAIVAAQPVPLAALRPDADPALIATIEHAMSGDPQHWFGSAEQMRAALWSPPPPRAALSLPPAAPRPPTRVLAQPLPPPPGPSASPSGPLAARRGGSGGKLVLATAALALLLAVILLAFDARPSTPPPAQPAGTSSMVPPPPAAPTTPPPTFWAPPMQAEQINPPRGRGADRDKERDQRRGER